MSTDASQIDEAGNLTLPDSEEPVAQTVDKTRQREAYENAVPTPPEPTGEVTRGKAEKGAETIKETMQNVAEIGQSWVCLPIPETRQPQNNCTRRILSAILSKLCFFCWQPASAMRRQSCSAGSLPAYMDMLLGGCIRR